MNDPTPSSKTVAFCILSDGKDEMASVLMPSEVERDKITIMMEEKRLNIIATIEGLSREIGIQYQKLLTCILKAMEFSDEKNDFIRAMNDGSAQSKFIDFLQAVIKKCLANEMNF